MLNGSGFGSSITLGPVQVRLHGVVRRDAQGKDIASVTAPTVAEATAALNRAAQVHGADAVVHVGSNVRRAMIAAPLSTQTFVEVQAWGTAVSHPEAPAIPTTEA